VTTGLLLCAATSALGVVLFVRAGRALAVPVSTSATVALPAIGPAKTAVRPTV